jgi:formate hydrogenlyase transcriptional activator
MQPSEGQEGLGASSASRFVNFSRASSEEFCLGSAVAMYPDGHIGSGTELRHYEALLQLADLMVHHHDLGELFSALADRLRNLTPFELLTLSLHDPAKNVMRVHVLDDHRLAPAAEEMAVEDVPAGWVWQNQQPLVMADLEAETRFPKALPQVRHRGIRSCCLVPLTTAQRRLGGMGFGSARLNAYGECDVQLLQRVAELAALAVENALTRAALRQEKERLQTLLEVNATLVSNRDFKQLFPAISGFIRKVINQEFASVALYDEATQSLRLHVLDFPAKNGNLTPGMVLPLKESAPGWAFLEREAKVFTREQLAAFHHPCTDLMLEDGVQSGCCIPLITAKGPLGVLNLASRTENAFLPQDISLLKQVAGQVAIAIDNARAYREIAQLKDKLTEEKRYLQGEIRTALHFEEIVGDSPPLTRVLGQVKTVAGSDATVLILGETGTGKELIARAVHRVSPRKEGSFIKLNCAAIPTGLLESELFGHEKGAFTGAISQKIGRLELADKGTLFLDEVGDIPLELQPKLLRVLQDQEFERLGSTRTICVDIRLVTATNRDLEAGVARREFRSDLFYRLNVFPIRMPTLRERRQDIPLLVRYFVQKFARQMQKNIEHVPTETIEALENWHWPGNVRELENFIERSVILSEGSTLRAPLAELLSRPNCSSDGTLISVEREHIVRILRESGGVVAGAHGAAAQLGMKRTTLQSMMKRLSIDRNEYGN